MTLGQRILFLRNKKGVTKSKLAELVGISHVQIGKYESGQSEPGSSIIERLSECLNTTTDYLIKGIEPLPPNLFTYQKFENYLKMAKELPSEDQKYLFDTMELLFLKGTMQKAQSLLNQSV